MTEQNQGQNEFAAVLMQHAKGRAHDKATELLAEAVEAVRTTGKSATVTVQLKINAVKNNDSVVAIEDKVTASIPEEKRGSMWFTDHKGGLHRNDPTQYDLFEENDKDGYNPDQTHEPSRGENA